MSRDIPAALRKLVAERARSRCEYCLIPDALSGLVHQIDHVLSRKHGGMTEPSNLAYCCEACNLFKGSDIATLDGAGLPIRLFNPREDVWSAHFRIEGGRITALSEKGEATIRLLRLNQPERVKERLLLQLSGSYPRQ